MERLEMADLFATFCRKKVVSKRDLVSSMPHGHGSFPKDQRYSLQGLEQEESHPYKVIWIVEIHHGSPTKSDGW
jgi:hypothetical protein